MHRTNTTARAAWLGNAALLAFGLVVTPLSFDMEHLSFAPKAADAKNGGGGNGGGTTG